MATEQPAKANMEMSLMLSPMAAVRAASIPNCSQSMERPCPLEAVKLLNSILSGPDADTPKESSEVILAVSSAFRSRSKRTAKTFSTSVLCSST